MVRLLTILLSLILLPSMAIADPVSASIAVISVVTTYFTVSATAAIITAAIITASYVNGKYQARSAKNKARKNQSIYTPSAYREEVVDATAPVPLIYGEVIMAGARIYISSSGGDNAYLYIIYAFGGEKINNFAQIYLNDTPSTDAKYGQYLESQTPIYEVRQRTIWVGRDQSVERTETYQDIVGYTNNYSSYLSTDTRLGTSNQSVIAGVPNWSEACAGYPLLMVKMKFNTDVYPQGKPNITAKVQGCIITDTRTNSQVYSNNPALILYHYLSLAIDRGGFGESVENIDVSSINTAANICDEMVNIGGGYTQKRYTFDGLVDTTQSPHQIIDDMLGAMDGTLAQQSGLIKIYAGAIGASVATITADWLAGAINIEPVSSLSDKYNCVRGEYYSMANRAMVEFPAIINNNYINADGRKNYLDVSYPFVNDPIRAQRLAKCELEQARRGMVVQIECNMRAFNLAVYDVVTVDITQIALNNKKFRVIAWQLNENGFGVKLVLREYDDAIYNWASVDATTQNITANLTQSDANSASAVIGLSAVSGNDTLIISNDGTVKPRIKLSWNRQYGFTAGFEVAVRALATTNVTTTTSSGLIQVASPYPNNGAVGTKLTPSAPSLATISAGGANLSFVEIFTQNLGRNYQLNANNYVNNVGLAAYSSSGIIPTGQYGDYFIMADNYGNVAPLGSYGVRNSNTNLYYYYIFNNTATSTSIVSSTSINAVKNFNASADATYIYIDDVVEDNLYQLEIKSITTTGVKSAPVAITHRVVGKLAPPPAPPLFNITRKADGTRSFSWTYPNPPADLLGFHIKYKLNGTAGDTYANMTSELFDGTIPASPFETAELSAGNYRFALVAIDSSNNKSSPIYADYAVGAAVGIDSYGIKQKIITTSQSIIFADNVQKVWVEAIGGGEDRSDANWGYQGEYVLGWFVPEAGASYNFIINALAPTHNGAVYVGKNFISNWYELIAEVGGAGHNSSSAHGTYEYYFSNGLRSFSIDNFYNVGNSNNGPRENLAINDSNDGLWGGYGRGSTYAHPNGKIRSAKTGAFKIWWQ